MNDIAGLGDDLQLGGGVSLGRADRQRALGGLGALGGLCERRGPFRRLAGVLGPESGLFAVLDLVDEAAGDGRRAGGDGQGHADRGGRNLQAGRRKDPGRQIHGLLASSRPSLQVARSASRRGGIPPHQGFFFVQSTSWRPRWM